MANKFEGGNVVRGPWRGGPKGPDDGSKQPEEHDEVYYARLAADLESGLTVVAEELDISEQEIEDKVELILQESGGGFAVPQHYLDDCAKKDVSQNKGDLLLALGAARAYLDLIELRDREGGVDI